MMDHLVSLPKSNNDIITAKHLALWFWCLRLEMAAVAVTLAVEETHLDREFGPYTWFVFGCIYELERNVVTSDLSTLKTTLNARVKHDKKLLNFESFNHRRINTFAAIVKLQCVTKSLASF